MFWGYRRPLPIDTRETSVKQPNTSKLPSLSIRLWYDDFLPLLVPFSDPWSDPIRKISLEFGDAFPKTEQNQGSANRDHNRWRKTRDVVPTKFPGSLAIVNWPEPFDVLEAARNSTIIVISRVARRVSVKRNDTIGFNGPNCRKWKRKIDRQATTTFSSASLYAETFVFLASVREEER